MVEDFLEVGCQGQGLALATRKIRRWHIRRFLFYLEQQGHSLDRLTPGQIDAYLDHLGQTWSRVSLSSTARVLRAWFRSCELKGKTRAGLADSILVPRIYRHEGLPLGPTWEQAKGIVTDLGRHKPLQLRDRAILLLLAVYGLRSGEVRRLRLDDIHWEKDRLSVVRSKNGRRELLPLEPHTGNAIAGYLRQGRPQCDRRCVFVTLKAPFRPLSAGALYPLVSHRLLRVGGPGKSRGPHASGMPAPVVWSMPGSASNRSGITWDTVGQSRLRTVGSFAVAKALPPSPVGGLTAKRMDRPSHGPPGEKTRRRMRASTEKTAPNVRFKAT